MSCEIAHFELLGRPKVRPSEREEKPRLEQRLQGTRVYNS